jgi:hypothetical protein
MTHPGVGPVTALATEVFVGEPARFLDGKALASYVGMIPREYSSGKRQRLGAPPIDDLEVGVPVQEARSERLPTEKGLQRSGFLTSPRRGHTLAF